MRGKERRSERKRKRKNRELLMGEFLLQLEDHRPNNRERERDSRDVHVCFEKIRGE